MESKSSDLAKSKCFNQIVLHFADGGQYFEINYSLVLINCYSNVGNFIKGGVNRKHLLVSLGSPGRELLVL